MVFITPTRRDYRYNLVVTECFLPRLDPKFRSLRRRRLDQLSRGRHGIPISLNMTFAIVEAHMLISMFIFVHINKYTYTVIYIYTHIYIYICMCTYVHICTCMSISIPASTSLYPYLPCLHIAIPGQAQGVPIADLSALLYGVRKGGGPRGRGT